VKIDFTVEEIKLILEILSLAPYYKVANLISKLSYLLNEELDKE